MGKKLPITPVSMIKGCFRILTMRCREAHAVRKRDGNACTKCHRKHSVAKDHPVQVQVHHTKKPDWDRIIKAIREELLDPANMVCICSDCHRNLHEADKSGWRGDYKHGTNSACVHGTDKVSLSAKEPDNEQHEQLPT
jgi:hypothetical protein